MPADLVPHAAIPDLARHVTAPMLEVLAYLQHAGFLQHGPELSPAVLEALNQLAGLGLVDPGYEGDAPRERPSLWVRNGNGSRVLGYRTGIRSAPHYQIDSADLAAWLEEQGDRWWNVDGDPLLTGRMTFPCPAARLVQELRRIDRPLIVQAHKDDSDARGQPVGKDRLDQVVVFVTRKRHHIVPGLLPDPPADRSLRLCWTDSLFEWTLTEDSRVTQLMGASDQGQARETAQVKKE